MQLEPSTAATYGYTHRGNPLCSVRAGARYLAALHRQLQSWRGASAGYYGGGFEAHVLQAAGLRPLVSWAQAAAMLNVVPNPLAAYANALYATAEQLIQQQHLPPL